MACFMCSIDPDAIVTENDLALAFRDSYPVSTGHTLVITRRHAETWFDATKKEQRALLELVTEIKATLDDELHPDGYNVGFNAGEAAGQTVMHLHLHVIPRFDGDIEDPRGGIRGAIPAKRIYEVKEEK